MKHMRVPVVFLVAALSPGCWSATQQQPPAPSVVTASASMPNIDPGIEAAAQRFLDAMRTRDTAVLGQVLHPQMRIMTTLRRGEDVRVLSLSRDQFLQTLGRATGPEWNQRLIAPTFMQDDGLAAMWSTYVFHRGTTLDHCGVMAMHLVMHNRSWSITQVSDTHRTNGCP